TEDMIRTFYLTSLCRPPNPEELRFWISQPGMNGSAEERQEVSRDILWSLLNSEEFSSNH
ncbi:MAG: hypothetical protein KDA89_18050, partial [Planctomycetaceae bacterium]|nr:hypothetical protein [Planctomycetaceae bacterium]